MTDLRARLAEVLAMPTNLQAEVYAQRSEMESLCRDPALDRALEDAERVAALEAENAALRARIAGGVRANIRIVVKRIYPALLIEPINQPAAVWNSLDGKTVVVMEDGDVAGVVGN